jgi:hypothetical protein
MITQRTPDGGLNLQLNGREARLLRFVAEKASFTDTPPEEAEEILRLADELLAALDRHASSKP